MKSSRLTLALILALASPLAAQTTILTGADLRPQISLNGEWSTIIDPYFSGLFNMHHQIMEHGYFSNIKPKPGDTGPIEYDYAKQPKLNVPGDWNTQKPELFWYEGLVWYEREFNYQPKPHTRVFLQIGAANYHSYFWANGKKICEHEGGFTAFACELTDQLSAGNNFIVAAVDATRHADGVPTLETDWFNYGGLTREVSLIEVPDSFIDQYDVHLARGATNKIEGWAHLVNAKPGQLISLTIPELALTAQASTNAEGTAHFSITADKLSLWSPENPKLYAVNLSTASDKIEEKIGFRTIETSGDKILLNGKPIFLRGISIHAEAPFRTGRAWTEQDAKTLLSWAKELSCNYVRLAHYPHDESMLREADRSGLLVWSENPVYWALQFDNPTVYQKAEQQLDEEIGTLRNHASIILWSMANETPNTPARTEFLTRLAAHTRALDPTRLITAALLVRAEANTKIVDDPLGNSLDVLGANEYIGWYEQHPASADQTTWDVRFNKPLIISEFGADAKFGLHGNENDRWTEEYQASVYRHQLAMLNRIPQLRGISPWILMDFRSPRRPLPGIQDGFNRKGLISDQGERKASFFILQKAYRDQSVGKPD